MNGSLPLKPILARVSRSFYLSLRLLPKATRHTTALAYLLARAADTVADTRLVSPPDRVRLLGSLERLFQGQAAGGERIATLGELSSLTRTADMIPEEKALLAELPTCLRMLQTLPEPELGLVRRVLEVIISGMQDDLTCFPGEASEDLAALEKREDLLHYCWQVAGCVGEFWSDLHAARLPSLWRLDRAAWRAQGLRLGRTLQMTNVLRDIGRDLSHGRCYVPREDLSAIGLAPEDLLEPTAWGRLRPLYEDLVAQAVDDAVGGLQYTLQIPPREVSLRLAGFLPLLLALLTLGIVLRHNPLDPASPRKVSRRTVYATLARGFLAVRQDRSLSALFRSTLRKAGLERYLAFGS